MEKEYLDVQERMLIVYDDWYADGAELEDMPTDMKLGLASFSIPHMDDLVDDTFNLWKSDRGIA